MKSRFYFRSVPFVATVAAVLSVCGSIWQTTALQRRNHAIHAGISTVPDNGATASGDAPAALAPGSPPAIRPGTPSAMADEQAALERAEAAIQTHCAELGIRPDEDIVSVGRYEQLASEGLQFIAAMVGLEVGRGEKTPKTPTLENMQMLSSWTAKSEIIGRLESDPVKIAKLHAAAIQTALKLDNSTKQTVQTAIAEEFKTLAASQLTKAQRPIEKQKDWYGQRDIALKEAAARIESAIPPDRRQPYLVERVLTLGTGMRASAGFDERTQKGFVTMGYTLPGTKGWKF
jgi:hypothetical protein